MGLLSALKVAVAKGADFYSRQACPWETLDRPYLPKTAASLKDREAECFSDLQDFWFFYEIIAHRIPQGRVPPDLDIGDQALWQGIYTAVLCFKYARAKSDSLAELIARALNGMSQHQWFHGEESPRLIRGYDRGSKAWQDDASNDSLTGHFAGLYFVLKYGPLELRDRALVLLGGTASELIENNLCLVKADKTPTTYGRLINGAFTDPLSMTLCLGILAVASHYGLHKDAGRLWSEVYTKYEAMIPYPKMILGQWENWNDDHRAALHLVILAMEDKSPRLQELVRKGLLRLWFMLKERGNSWVNALILLGLGDGAPAGMASQMRRQARMILGEYELVDKRWDTEVDWRGIKVGNVWTGKILFGINARWAPRVVSINGHDRSTQPLPAWSIGKQDFIWQRHRYSVSDWLGQSQPTQKFNAMDYLAAYHASRLAGILEPDD